MNKRTLVASLLLKGCLLGNTVIAAEEKAGQHLQMASFTKDSLPGFERSLLEYARAGDRNAQLALARIYESENKYDPNLMVEWYKKSAVNGNAEAQFQLGLLYIDEELPDDDGVTGMYWIEMAAEQGHTQAQMVFESLENENYSFGC